VRRAALGQLARMAATGRIRIGIGGWNFEPWRQSFYPADLPKKDELAYAAGRLTAIEINGTFYRTPTPETFAAWREAVPDGFVFTLKAPRYTTNRKVLAEAGESAGRFAEAAAALGDRLGPINWQLAPTKRFDPADMEAFLAGLPRRAAGLALRHAVELRHPSFRAPEMVELARRHGVAIVWAADSKHPEIADPTADFAYVRLMGTAAGEPLGYGAAALDGRAGDLAALAAGGAPRGAELLAPPAEAAPRDVFCFVIGGHKVANPAAAMALIEQVGAG
jgi:uncharacterized protein YecE (DUF72 family)